MVAGFFVLHGVQGVAGSNPVSPTTEKPLYPAPLLASSLKANNLRPVIILRFSTFNLKV